MLTGTVILSIGIFNGVMLSSILWFAKQSRFMALGILVYCLMLLKYLGYWVEFLPDQRFIAELLRPIELLLGPLVLGCFYRLESRKLNKEWLHYLPAILLLFVAVGNYTYNQLTSANSYSFGYYVFLFKMTHEVAYVAAASWLFRKSLDRTKILLIIFFATQWAISLLYLLYRFEGEYNLVNWFLFGGMAFSINYLAYVALKQSSLLNNNKSSDSHASDLPIVEKSESNLAEATKKEVDVHPIYLNLLKVLEEEELFLSQNLKISDISKALGVPEKTVSRAVNEHAGENFNAFINRFRVNYSASLITSESHSHYTIDAIAEESGFANKVSFYKAFKRVKGISPSEYRRESSNGAYNNLLI